MAAAEQAMCRREWRLRAARHAYGNVPRWPFFIAGVLCSGPTPSARWFSFCFSGLFRASALLPALFVPGWERRFCFSALQISAI
jgi:hypothetical protein